MKSPLVYFHLVSSALGSLFTAFRRQKLLPLFFFGSLLLFLAILFGFLAFTPVLSPFIYPLF